MSAPNPAGKRVMLRTARGGRWVWWTGLQVVDLCPKGKRTPVVSIPLRDRDNTEAGVYHAIAWYYADWRALMRSLSWWSESPNDRDAT